MAEQVETEVEEVKDPAVEAPVAKESTVEPLTEREIAIARGEDPDEVESPQAEESTSTEETEQGGQADEGSQATGKDAAARPASWIDDDILALGAQYGLNAEALAQFPDAKSFTQAAALHDQNLAKQAAAPAAEQEPPKPTQQEEPKKIDTAKAGVDKDGKPQRIDRRAFQEAGYGESELALIDQHNALVDYIEKRDAEIAPALAGIAAWQKQQTAAEQLRQANEFHDVLDSMDETLYGRSVKDGKPVQLTPEQQENRRKVWETEQGIPQNSPLRQGSRAAVLKRMHMSNFGEYEINKKVAEQEKRISDQSKRRRPAASRPMRPIGGGAGKPEAKSDEDYIMDVVNNPDVVKLYDRFQEENGAK